MRCFPFCLFVLLAGIGMSVLLLSRLWTEAMARPWIVPAYQAPAWETAIVFGGGVDPGNVPSRALQVRLETAHWLYQHGRVRRLLLSGARAYQGRYDEVAAMAAYLQARGVPREALWLDSLGVRTLETCRRARTVFGLKRALLVTHRYHLPRALLLCRAWGLEALGVPVMHPAAPAWERAVFWYGRESLATVKALLDLLWLHPPPPWPGTLNGRNTPSEARPIAPVPGPP